MPGVKEASMAEERHTLSFWSRYLAPARNDKIHDAYCSDGIFGQSEEKFPIQRLWCIRPSMEDVQKVLSTLEDLCTSIRQFKADHLEQAIFHSPVIDHFHPDDYDQRGITGLNKFLGLAETERDYVSNLLESGRPPKDLATNAPNLLAIWHEFLRSPWPISSIAQHVDCGTEGQVKVDVVAGGGDLWVKVNTTKESRLMAEFREQDSYINSDYDDTDSESEVADSRSSLAFTNSLIAQAESLIKASKSHVRPLHFPPPRIRFVLCRLEESPEGGYRDERIPKTFAALRELGVELVLGSQPIEPFQSRPLLPLVPTKRIMLDLSVIVALCCDSTHQPLPQNQDELEARFRPLQMDEEGKMELADHTNVSKDLRDQLGWEMEHPVIEEIQSRLEEFQPGEVEWFVTREVKDRTPGIVTLIGGPKEQARARALYGESEESFWYESRYEGKEGILRDLKVKVIEDEGIEDDISRLALNDSHTLFEKGLITVCERMLGVVEGKSADTSRSPSPAPIAQPTGRHRGGRGQMSRRSKRPYMSFPPPQRLPSQHTLRTLLLGVRAGMTVLTNNRGAVGKITREMGVSEGLPFDHEEDRSSGRQKAAVWVVNPSSLAEWRRLEVERANTTILGRKEPVNQNNTEIH